MNKNLPRLKSAKPASAPYVVAVVWEGGGRETIDMTGVVMREDAFAALRDPKAFATLRLARWGWGIEWPNGLDYAPDSLARLAEAQREMTAKEFAGWQERLALSNAEAAEILDRSLSSIKEYRTGGRAIPRSVALTCRTLERDGVMLSALYRPRLRGRPRSKAA